MTSCGGSRELTKQGGHIVHHRLHLIQESTARAPRGRCYSDLQNNKRASQSYTRVCILAQRRPAWFLVWIASARDFPTRAYKIRTKVWNGESTGTEFCCLARDPDKLNVIPIDKNKLNFALAREHEIVVTLGSHRVYAGLAGDSMPCVAVSPYYTLHQQDSLALDVLCSAWSRRGLGIGPEGVIRSFLIPSFGLHDLPIGMFVEETSDSMELVTLDNFRYTLMGMDRLSTLIMHAVRRY